MEYAKIDKKLREARFFLSKMCHDEQQVFGAIDHYDFYLSAFLNATRTVDYRLRKEQPTYPAWRSRWDKTLIESQRCLIKFLIDDRNSEVHESGSGRDETIIQVPLNNTYSDETGHAFVSRPRGVPAPMALKPEYQFSINGVSRKVSEACAEYLNLLDIMVAKFKADNR